MSVACIIFHVLLIAAAGACRYVPEGFSILLNPDIIVLTDPVEARAC